MPLIDSDSKLLFFLCVVLVTTLVTLSKFVFFTFDYYYTIRQMIFFGHQTVDVERFSGEGLV